jgi:hypothetical protein
LRPENSGNGIDFFNQGRLAFPGIRRVASDPIRLLIGE